MIKVYKGYHNPADWTNKTVTVDGHELKHEVS